jgi:hypothetical protein
MTAKNVDAALSNEILSVVLTYASTRFLIILSIFLAQLTGLFYTLFSIYLDRPKQIQIHIGSVAPRIPRNTKTTSALYITAILI